MITKEKADLVNNLIETIGEEEFYLMKLEFEICEIRDFGATGEGMFFSKEQATRIHEFLKDTDYTKVEPVSPDGVLSIEITREDGQTLIAIVGNE